MFRLLLSLIGFVFLGLLWAAPAWAPAWLAVSVAGLAVVGFLGLFSSR